MHYRSLLVVALVLAGCRGPGAVTGMPTASVIASAAESPNPHANHVMSKNNEPVPEAELKQARTATARYNSVTQALKDGYVDIGVVLPNMGRHLLKESLLDATFDAEHPELLVYREDLGGNLRLVAVEYAVPLSLTPTAPEGFTGAADTWFRDTTFQLWTLHAWVWKDNPDGVFNATNRLVP